jgi:hypothetical protein
VRVWAKTALAIIAVFLCATLAGFPVGTAGGSLTPLAVANRSLAQVAAALKGWASRSPSAAVSTSKCRVAGAGQALAKTERIFDSPSGSPRQQVDATVEVRASAALAARFVRNSVDAATMTCTRERLEAAVRKALHGTATLAFVPHLPSWLRMRGLSIQGYQLAVSRSGLASDYGIVAIFEARTDPRVVYVLANDQSGSPPRALTLRLVTTLSKI